MKKITLVLVALTLLVTACQLGTGQAGQPTPIALPTGGASSNTAVSTSERQASTDGMNEVQIPEGTFNMGGIDPRAASDEKPVHQVTMHAFWIDKVEVTNGMYQLCVKANTCKLPQEFKSQSRPLYYSNVQFNDYPVVYVTWLDAKTYCEWAGRRLPTEAEWERAARGDDTRTYPWGDQVPDSNRANFNHYIGDTTPVGSLTAGASPYGVLDMAGNVGEWVNDLYSANYYASGVSNNPPGPGNITTSFNRVVRGGSFDDPEQYIRVSKRASVLGSNVNATLDSPQWLGDFSARIGFRCASDN